MRAVWAHSTPVREAESRRGFELIGPTDLHFHTLPDGDVVDHLGALADLVRGHAAEFQPTDVVSMHFEQGHLDHDACSWAAWQVTGVRHWEFPMYHTYLTAFQKLGRFSRPEGQHILSLDAEEQRFKTALTHCYPSQTLRRNIVAYQVARLLMLSPISLAHTERFLVDARPDFRAPNHPPRLARRVAESDRWRRWLAALDRVG